MEEIYNNNLDFIWETSWNVFRHYHQPTHKHQVISLIDLLKPLTNLDVLYGELTQVSKLNLLPHYHQSLGQDVNGLQLFLQSFDPVFHWIKKSVHPDNGQYTEVFTNAEQVLSRFPFQTDSIVQPYIRNPLLLEGKKVQLRNFVLVVCTDPWLILYHPGYVRVSNQVYQADSGADDGYFQDRHLLKASGPQDLRAWRTVIDQLENGAALQEKIKKSLTLNYLKLTQSMRQKLGRFEIFENEILADEHQNIFFSKLVRDPLASLDNEIGSPKIPDILQILNLALPINEQTTNDLRNMLRAPQQYFEFGDWEILFNEAANYNFATQSQQF